MSLQNVTVVLRSVRERTEALARALVVAQGLPESSVFIVRKAPFSEALKSSFQVGVDEMRPWTMCVDADLLLRPCSISRMIRLAELQRGNVCQIQGYILDKFFGGSRSGGIHLYRTSLLPEVSSLIPPEGTDIRPETYALNKMKANGYPWISFPEVVGLHDFEQSYTDIFRKSFVYAHKHIGYFDLFLTFWREMAPRDPDYRVALSGLAAGIRHIGEVRIDKRAKYFLESIEERFEAEKPPLNPRSWSLEDVEKIFQEWRVPAIYREKHPAGSAFRGKSVVRRTFAVFEEQANDKRFIAALIWTAGWVLQSIGKHLQKLGLSQKI